MSPSGAPGGPASPDGPDGPDRGKGATGGDALPPELDALVRRTVAAAGLSGGEADDVARELRDHLRDGLEGGRTADDLIRRFGDPRTTGRRIAEVRRRPPATTRRRRGGRMGLEWFATELRRAVRRLIRAPGFAALVVVTLALGVGANTAVFTVLDAVLLEPLPYDEPDRLVRMFARWDEGEAGISEHLRAPTIRAASEWTDLFEGFAALYTYRETGRDLVAPGVPPERLTASLVSAGWFEMLGIEPALGRTFRREESMGPGAASRDVPPARVTILSDGLWRRRFGADPHVVGRAIELGGESWEVVGVMPPGTVDPLGPRAQLWLPQDLRPGGSNGWDNFYLTGVGRLAPGLSLPAARERLQARWAGLVEAVPEAEGPVPVLRPLDASVVGARRASMLWILAAAVGLVLVSACVNVANLVFARSLGRDRDVALRGALGSDRIRLVTHLLAESVVLAVAGGVAGLALGWVGMELLLDMAPEALPTAVTPRLSPRVFAFSLGATAVALVLFGLGPALRSARTPAAASLRAGGRSGTESRSLRRVRDGLVVAQVAVALVLVVGAGLLLRSFDALRSVPLGIETRDVVTYEVHLPDRRYPDGEARHRFQTELQRRVGSLPGVQRSGSTSWLPANGRYHTWGVQWNPDGSESLPDEGWRSSDMRIVDGDYFGALDIAVLRGRTPAEVDPEGEPVVWINRTLERQLFGERDAVGERLFAGNAFRRVAGVVEDVPHEVHGDRSPKAYLLHAQYADNRNWPLIHTVRLRPGTSPAPVREAVRTELAALDPALVLHRFRPFDALLSGRRAQDRFAATLMAVFAALAVTLAAVGTYGLLAGSVARRRREIGIRMALGADPGRVRRAVFRSAAILLLLGAALGGVGAWLAGRWMSSLLFGVALGDPWAWIGGLLLLAAPGLVAGWIPARRATRVAPASSLAAE